MYLVSYSNSNDIQERQHRFMFRFSCTIYMLEWKHNREPAKRKTLCCRHSIVITAVQLSYDCFVLLDSKFSFEYTRIPTFIKYYH